MTEDNEAASLAVERARLLSRSFRFDAERYSLQAGVPEGMDPALHYVQLGWRYGWEPLRNVEVDFMRPYFQSAGLDGAPAAIWCEFEALGLPLPANRGTALNLAHRVRQSRYFDVEFYRRFVPSDLDPALHYAVIGEAIGLRPNPKFDPRFYRTVHTTRLPWIQATLAVLDYEEVGQFHGWPVCSLADELIFDPLPEDERPVVLVICHEASRTGAPILGWNIIRRLSTFYRVVSVLMRGGELEADFRQAAAASVTNLSITHWRSFELEMIAQRLAQVYCPVYAIANSIETSPLVPFLVQAGVPVVALIHEFAAYTRPLAKLNNVFDSATHIVFPAQMVAESSYRLSPGLIGRTGIHIAAQGRSVVPRLHESEGSIPAPPILLRPKGAEDAIVILGAGAVQLRKGVELFVATAVAARRKRPDLKLRFVWVGHGFDPDRDLTYSIYLDEQIRRSDLGDSFAMLEAVDDIDSLYQQSDIFLLSSRLDPQPNVGIDTMMLGIPTVCFEGGAGTAEILAADPATRDLVVPHLDIDAAAELICELAENPGRRAALKGELIRVATGAFDMETYIRRVDALGRDAVARRWQADVNLLAEAGAVDPSLLFPPYEDWPASFSRERWAIQQFALWNGIEACEQGREWSRPFRRACAGFHPTVYALAHRDECLDQGRDPLAHWIRAGRPPGPWARPVFTPGMAGGKAGVRVALHAHFHYPELLGDLLRRLKDNHTEVDLFLTTNTVEKKAALMAGLRRYPGRWTIDVTPNRGRDVGPFLDVLTRRLLPGGYEVIGHVHAKRSLAVDAQMGERWRNFLWSNLIGGPDSMVDVVASAFDGDAQLGLLFAEDPHVVGWDGNKAIAEDLAGRMGLDLPLANMFDFPLGTMFWARSAALRPLAELELDYESYPEEPLPNDGTILHALERLMPFIASHAGFHVGGLRVPGTSW